MPLLGGTSRVNRPKPGGDKCGVTRRAVLSRLSLVRARATDTSWDTFGMPRTILVDNGSEFHGEALTRGCAEYGIALTYRPVARPRFGGHIERLILNTRAALVAPPVRAQSSDPDTGREREFGAKLRRLGK